MTPCSWCGLDMAGPASTLPVGGAFVDPDPKSMHKACFDDMLVDWEKRGVWLRIDSIRVKMTAGLAGIIRDAIAR